MTCPQRNMPVAKSEAYVVRLRNVRNPWLSFVVDAIPVAVVFIIRLSARDVILYRHAISHYYKLVLIVLAWQAFLNLLVSFVD